VDIVSIKNKPVLTFLKIPKNASTSISHNLREIAKQLDHVSVIEPRQDLYHTSMHNISDPTLVSSDKFCILRHPYERIKSLWRFHNKKHNQSLTFDEFFINFFASRCYEYKQLDPQNFYFYAEQWHWAMHCNHRIHIDTLNTGNNYMNLLQQYFPQLHQIDCTVKVLNTTVVDTEVKLTVKQKSNLQHVWHNDFEHLGFEC